MIGIVLYLWMITVGILVIQNIYLIIQLVKMMSLISTGICH